MKREPPIQVDGAVRLSRRRHGNARSQIVIAFFKIRHDDIQAVSRAALKDRYENFSFVLALRCRAKKPRRRDTQAGYRESGGTKKVTSCEHTYLLCNSGELKTRLISKDGDVPFSWMPS